MNPSPIRAAAFLVALFTVAACARSVAVETDPDPTYAVQVENPMPHEMIVSYRDAEGTHLLGSVPAGGSERFVVVTPAGMDVTVIATDTARTHTVENPVRLRIDETVAVRLGGS